MQLAQFRLSRQLAKGTITPEAYEAGLLSATRTRDSVVDATRKPPKGRKTSKADLAAQALGFENNADYQASIRAAAEGVADRERAMNPFPAIQAGSEAFNERLTDVRKNLRDLAKEIPDLRTPLMQFVDDLEAEGANIDMALSGIAADGLDSLGDGLADAIAGTQSLGDAFKNVATQIIADLARIAIRQSIVKPLASALSLGSGGGIFSALGSVFGGGKSVSSTTGGVNNIASILSRGRASGGYVEGGQMYRVNEGASPGRVEGFRPLGSGHVIPLGQMNAARPGGGITISPNITIDARGASDPRMVEQIARAAVAQGLAETLPMVVSAANGQTMRTIQRPRLPGSLG